MGQLSFEDGVWHLLEHAFWEAKRLQHAEVTPEHVLCCCESLPLFEVLRINGSNLRREIKRRLASEFDGSQTARGPYTCACAETQYLVNLPISTDTRKVLQLACNEAASTRESSVGIEHLILGILWLGDGIAYRVLSVSHRLDLERVRSACIAQRERGDGNAAVAGGLRSVNARESALVAAKQLQAYKSAASKTQMYFVYLATLGALVAILFITLTLTNRIPFWLGVVIPWLSALLLVFGVSSAGHRFRPILFRGFVVLNCVLVTVLIYRIASVAGFGASAHTHIHEYGNNKNHVFVARLGSEKSVAGQISVVGSATVRATFDPAVTARSGFGWSTVQATLSGLGVRGGSYQDTEVGGWLAWPEELTRPGLYRVEITGEVGAYQPFGYSQVKQERRKLHVSFAVFLLPEGHSNRVRQSWWIAYLLIVLMLITVKLFWHESYSLVIRFVAMVRTFLQARQRKEQTGKTR